MRFCIWFIILVLPAAAQSRLSRTARLADTSPFPISQPTLRRMVRDSGRIFAGTVTSIQRVSDGPGVPITRVTFRVEQAIQGVKKGQSIQIGEWGGLWQAGERYRVGERVLLFLYPQSKLGLTSPVAGNFGRWSIQSGRAGSPARPQIQNSELARAAAAIRRAALE